MLLCLSFRNGAPPKIVRGVFLSASFQLILSELHIVSLVCEGNKIGISDFLMYRFSRFLYMFFRYV